MQSQAASRRWLASPSIWRRRSSVSAACGRLIACALGGKEAAATKEQKARPMSATAESKYLLITREFDAPPELVWKCWTEPEHMQAWFGPHSFDLPIARIDLRVGGKWFAMMRG